ncbi:MAG: hypothetical protein ACRDD7_09315 [Peptostreptococcaceae bacterium]
MFVVTWIDDDNINVRVYSKKEYAVKLINWCRECKLRYSIAEEEIDRDIINYRKPTQKMVQVVKNLKIHGFISQREYLFSLADFNYCSEIIGKHQKRMHQRFREFKEIDNMFKTDKRCHYEYDMIYN